MPSKAKVCRVGATHSHHGEALYHPLPFPPLPTRRERSKVPYIVRQCVEEVEKRGIEEVGIYRISGVATDIQALKTVFDASESGRPHLGSGGQRAL